MISLFIGNFGKRNSVQNGQTQKAIQILRLLSGQLHLHPARVDSGDYLRYALSFALAVSRGQPVGLCVGPKGIRLAGLIFAALAPILPRSRSITLFVVGGWLPGLAARSGHVALLCRASRVLVEIQGLGDELAALGIGSELFPNFRDLPIQERLRDFDIDSIRLLYCGRIGSAKGAGRALELLDALRKHVPGARLDFFGPLEEAELTEKIDQTEGATYCGSFDDVSATAKIFPLYDFLVLPSAYPGECVPGAVVESMFAGLPSIVSNWRFLPEVVHHQRTGFVCNLENFAGEAVTNVLSMSPGTYKTMSRACTDLATLRYSADSARKVLES